MAGKNNGSFSDGNAPGAGARMPNHGIAASVGQIVGGQRIC